MKKLLIIVLAILAAVACNSPKNLKPGDPPDGDCRAGTKTELTNILFFSGYDDSLYNYYFINTGDPRFKEDTVKISDSTFIASNFKRRDRIGNTIHATYQIIIKDAATDSIIVQLPIVNNYPLTAFTKHKSKITFQRISLDEALAAGSIKPIVINPPVPPKSEP